MDSFKKAGWKFTTHIDSANLYRRTSNPLIAFLEDEYESSEDGYISKNDFVVAHNDYAKANKLPLAASKNALGTDMKNQTVIPVGTGWPSVKGKQVESWTGIKRKSS